MKNELLTKFSELHRRSLVCQTVKTWRNWRQCTLVFLPGHDRFWGMPPFFVSVPMPVWLVCLRRRQMRMLSVVKHYHQSASACVVGVWPGLPWIWNYSSISISIDFPCISMDISNPYPQMPIVYRLTCRPMHWISPKCRWFLLLDIDYRNIDIDTIFGK